MENPLDITPSQIALLSSEDLRELVGRLCEEDFRSIGNSASGVFYGGHENEPDAGIDVLVDSITPPPKNSFIHRANVILQVKLTDLPKSRILKEMKPNDELRHEIKDLISKNGGYIIVSSANCTAIKIKNRIQAMKEAVSSEPNAHLLHLDYIDASRIATWVRNHPILTFWIRSKINTPNHGWMGYENWSNLGEKEDPYIIDSKFRLRNDNDNKAKSVEEGIKDIQKSLAPDKPAVRLAGLSGVGKTRLAQALFDSSISESALSKTRVVYTDISFSPKPTVSEMLNYLAIKATNAILIIDNCPRELHTSLSKQLKGVKNKKLTLLTIEYDVDEGIHEESNAFHLENASDTLISELLEKRFPDLSRINLEIICDFASGNARVAIYLARTINKNESLVGLKDEELFARLFWQRKEEHRELYQIATVLAILYSFNGITDNKGSEISILAEIAQKPERELLWAINTLAQREIIQSRGQWRAILPQAIANRLASIALKNIPKHEISNNVLKGSERFIKSFSKRLGFLHKEPAAIEIANEWLGKDGWIGQHGVNLNKFGFDVFWNIAPLDLESSLKLLESSFSNPIQNKLFSVENSNHSLIIEVLKGIAYEDQYFLRSMRLLIPFALSEIPIENKDQIKNDIACFFQPVLSGTHASNDKRLKILKDLIQSNIAEEYILGFSWIEHALNLDGFTYFSGQKFGCTIRDYGYEPRLNSEYIKWYKDLVELLIDTGINDPIKRKRVNRALSFPIRKLILNSDLYNLIYRYSSIIREEDYWHAGWVSVRDALYYDLGELSKGSISRINTLERVLRPKTLLEKVIALNSNQPSSDFDFMDDQDETYVLDQDNNKNKELYLNKEARKIGSKIANNEKSLKKVLEVLFSMSNPNRDFQFGEGIYEGSTNASHTFHLLQKCFLQASENHRNALCMIGFFSLWKKDEPNRVNFELEQMIFDPVWGRHYIHFELVGGLTEGSINRLQKAIHSNEVPNSSFGLFSYGKRAEYLTDSQLLSLFREFEHGEDTQEVFLEILSMRLHRRRGDKLNSKSISLIIEELLLSPDIFNSKYQKQNGIRQENIRTLLSAILCSKDSARLSETILKNLLITINEFKTTFRKSTIIFREIASKTPHVFLSIMLDSNIEKLDFITHYTFEDRNNPFKVIKDSVVLSWSLKEPTVRIPRVIKAFPPFIDPATQWFKPIIHEFFDNLDDKTLIFEDLYNSLHLKMVIGSRAAAMSRRVLAFVSLKNHKNPYVSKWAQTSIDRMNEDILRHKEKEAEYDSRNEERFE